jgi:glucose-1-phosphate adenylyltransferase
MCTPDYEDIIAFHQAKGADVTMVCRKVGTLPAENVTVTCDAEGRISEILSDDTSAGEHVQCMNMFVIAREKLIEYIRTGHSRQQNHFVRHVLMNHTDEIKTYCYLYEDYASQITSIRSYYDANMSLLDDANLSDLFDSEPIYTKVRDSAPTRYAMDAKVNESLVADGCILEGTVENSVLFRGVQVKKGAVVRNSILMQDTVVEEGACVDCVITDKNVTISAGKSVSGSTEYPVYVEKHVKV